MTQGTVNGHYRAIVPLQELERRGHSVHWPGDPALHAFRNGSKPGAWDAMHVQNVFDDHTVALMERLRGTGIAVVWDTWAESQTIRAGGARWQAAFRDAVQRARGG